MREYFISSRASHRLAALGATDAELDGIEAQVAELAKKPKLGYYLPFYNPRELWRFDVGRFGLIYRFDHKSLEVVAVES